MTATEHSHGRLNCWDVRFYLPAKADGQLPAKLSGVRFAPMAVKDDRTAAAPKRKSVEVRWEAYA
jgi:hypothetical protein